MIDWMAIAIGALIGGTLGVGLKLPTLGIALLSAGFYLLCVYLKG